MTSPSDIVSETFTGNEKPEGFDASIRDAYAQRLDPYSNNILDHCPPGGCRPDIVDEVVMSKSPTRGALDPVPEMTVVPPRDTDDWATLAAWYHGKAASLGEHYRKVQLAQCAELVRAHAAVSETKVSEARINDLAHLHPLYLGFLADLLNGKAQWEHEYRTAGGLP